ncbi:DUF1206 domain-containing protein [Pontibacter qinzhouensis]|uniref:DUF1206 domain-containing protein n=1 Tax=Pontibacter qinzhouensis TaxID=2603253 RepID=A0A5C8K8K2_9BACT|nr:DUF1206 domain-containing protein [Pontibacter qinzhouensis]TXK46947.1 DUF1206 domain-containing protein [Pontibacter qinzhouensis]
MNIANMAQRLPSPQPAWVIRFARLGLAAKGVVYCLVGILAFMAAFELGDSSDQQAGKQDVFRFILKQPFGKALLAVVVVGMLCYTLWRLIQAIKDTDNRGSDAKGLGSRIGYASSGVVYGSFAFYAAKLVIGSGGGSGQGEDSRQTLARELLSQPFGQWLAGAVALGMMGMGIYQFYRAFSGSYKKKIKESEIRQEVKGLLVRAGKVGYVARGVVWLIIGYMFLRAALEANSREAGGSQSAFQFLESSAYGSFLLGAVALGLLCYGVFMFVRAKYEIIKAA